MKNNIVETTNLFGTVAFMFVIDFQGAASVADLSTWLQEVSMGEKNLEDYKKNRGRRDDGKLETPR